MSTCLLRMKIYSVCICDRLSIVFREYILPLRANKIDFLTQLCVKKLKDQLQRSPLYCCFLSNV